MKWALIGRNYGQAQPSRVRRVLLALQFVAATTFSLPADSLHAAVNPLSVNPFMAMKQTTSGDITAFTKWTTALPRFHAQQKTAQTECYGEGCLNKQWEEMLSTLRGKPTIDQVTAIHEFFNAVPYVSDKENYSTNDYWQTPYELMENGGDCEDYAIAKYISLQRLGVPEHDLRILVVYDNGRDGIVHAVLEVTLADGSYILDNQSDQVLRAADMKQYQPMFAINGSQWWAFK